MDGLTVDFIEKLFDVTKDKATLVYRIWRKSLWQVIVFDRLYKNNNIISGYINNAMFDKRYRKLYL